MSKRFREVGVSDLPEEKRELWGFDEDSSWRVVVDAETGAVVGHVSPVVIAIDSVVERDGRAHAGFAMRPVSTATVRAR